MELEVPKRHVFMSTLSTVMVERVSQWESQKKFSSSKCQGTMAEKCHFRKKSIFFSFFLPNVFIVMKKEGKKKGSKVKHEENSQNYPLWPYIKKNKHIHFWVHGHFSLSMFSLHLVRGPKAWANFMVHNVNSP